MVTKQTLGDGESVFVFHMKSITLLAGFDRRLLL